MSDRSLPIDEVKAQSRSNMSDRQKVELLREHLARLIRFCEDAPRVDFKEDRTISWLVIATENAKQALTATDK